MEIKPQDLRLGNWVKHPNKDDVYQVEEISLTLTVRAIELTPEWLERFGFKIHSDYDYRNYILQHNRRFMISMWLGEGKPAGFEEYGTCYWGDDFKVIKTVHSLQNLYFALTGEELAIDKHTSNGN